MRGLRGALIVLALGLAACTDTGGSETAEMATPETDLPLFVGYRSADDPCQRVGEDAYTNQFLDDAADLVACPEDYDGLAEFQSTLNPQEMARRDGYILYSVPVR